MADTSSLPGAEIAISAKGFGAALLSAGLALAAVARLMTLINQSAYAQTAYALSDPRASLVTNTTAFTPSVFATVTVGYYPYGVGVNSYTNHIFVGSWNPIPHIGLAAGTIGVIDGASQAVVTTVPVGTAPEGIGVDAATNVTYVANTLSNTVSVIDGVTNTVVATVTVQGGPTCVGVNPITNRIYVANWASNNVTVVEGVSNTVVIVAVVWQYHDDLGLLRQLGALPADG